MTATQRYMVFTMLTRQAAADMHAGVGFRLTGNVKVADAMEQMAEACLAVADYIAAVQIEEKAKP